MQRINYDIIEKMLKSADEAYKNKVRFNISLLIEYANHVCTMECKIRELIKKDDGMSSYMIKELEHNRWLKHDEAIAGLYTLNVLSADIGEDKVYEGSFEDQNRGEIAQAIFEFCKWYLDK